MTEKEMKSTAAENSETTNELWTAYLPENGGRFRYRVGKDGVILDGYDGSAGEISVPSQIDGRPVTEIGWHAFYDNGLNIIKIRFPGSVKRIDSYAMEFCVCLNEVELSEGLEYLGSNVFSATQVLSCRLPSTVRDIKDAGEYECEFLPEEGNPFLTADGGGIYKGSELIAISPFFKEDSFCVRPGTKAIRRHAMMNCTGLKTVILPESCESLGEGAFFVQTDPEHDLSSSEILNGTGKRLSVKTSGNERIVKNEWGIYAVSDNGRDSTLIYLDRDNSSSEEMTAEKIKGNMVKIIPDGTNLVRIGEDACRKAHLTGIYIPDSVKISGIGQNAFLDNPISEVLIGDACRSIEFPSDHTALMNELLEGFGRNDLIYDYSDYDKAIMDGVFDRGKLTMALSRLKRDIPPDLKEKITGKIRRSIDHITDLMIASPDLKIMRGLLEGGFYKKEDLDRAAERASRQGQTEILTLVLDYSHRHFSSDDFDYSI